MKLTIELEGNFEAIKGILNLKDNTPEESLSFLADRAKDDGCEITSKEELAFNFNNEKVGISGKVFLEK